jgi:hypothetical protein
MTRPIKLVHDCATGVVEEIELTDLEIEQREADAATFLEQKAEDERAANEKAALRDSVIAKLGLTPDEIAALLG